MSNDAYQPSYYGVGLMLTSQFMANAMLARAEKIKAAAEGIAPKDTGDYARSFKTHAVKRGRKKKNRATAYVTNDDPIGFYLEYGTEDTPAFHTLGKSMRAR